MKAIARLFHPSPGSAPAGINNARKSSPHPQTVDCVFILGPGMEGLADHYESQMRHQGLKAVMIGDGKGDISRDMIDRVRRSGAIGPDTQIICQLHGRVSGNQGATTHEMQVRHGKDLPGQPGARYLSTREIVRWLREPLMAEGTGTDKVDAWSGTIHLVSCRVGAVRKDAARRDGTAKDIPNGTAHDTAHGTAQNQTPDGGSSPGQGNVILYGGNKMLLAHTARSNLRSLFIYLGECKRNQAARPDMSVMFDRVKTGSMDTVVLLNDDLKEVKRSRAPQALPEVLPEYHQAMQRQQSAHDQLDLASGGPRVAKKSSAKTTESLWKTLSGKEQEKVAHYLLVRINHLKTEEKLEQFKRDLRADPALASITIGSLTPLMLLAIRGHTYQGQKVKHSDIARALIDAGADIHARDRSGKTVAHHAAKKGAAGVLRALYDDQHPAQTAGKKLDIDARDYSGATAACYAAKAGNYHALELLLDKQARMRGVDASGFGTLLHYACRAESDRFATVRCLLNKGARSLINKRDLTGKTALHIAVMAGDADTVQALLDAGANPAQRTLGFSTPSDLARALKGEQGAKILQLLKNAKAKKEAAPG